VASTRVRPRAGQCVHAYTPRAPGALIASPEPEPRWANASATTKRDCERERERERERDCEGEREHDCKGERERKGQRETHRARARRYPSPLLGALIGNPMTRTGASGASGW